MFEVCYQVLLAVDMSGVNPWLDDDLPVARKGPSRWEDGDDFEDFDPNKDYVNQLVKQKETSMLDSTMNSLKLLDESERIGVASGEVSGCPLCCNVLHA